jgi:hypothetical protein
MPWDMRMDPAFADYTQKRARQQALQGMSPSWMMSALAQLIKFREQGGLAGLMGQEPVQTKADRIMANKGSNEDLMDVYGGFAGIMAGPGAKTANLMKLRLAKRMAKAGTDRKEVWEKTGWFKGLDDKWRFEIPDTGAKLKVEPSKYRPDSRPMGDILHHPELYKAYPHARDIPTKFDILEYSGLRGAYSPHYRDISLKGSEPASNVRGTTLHELQHAVQHREGFASGGNAGTATSLSEPLKWRHREVQGEIWKVEDNQFMTAAAKTFKLKQLNREADALLKRIKDLEDPTDVYTRLMGEVEARNVEARNVEGRVRWRNKQEAPWVTEDVPAYRQVFAPWTEPFF